jgi:hypothetical protein
MIMSKCVASGLHSTISLEAELNYFYHWWNTHSMCKTRTATCPGGIPNDIYTLPHLSGSQDYLCDMDAELFLQGGI